jgi:hypothetical protein
LTREKKIATNQERVSHLTAPQTGETAPNLKKKSQQLSGIFLDIFERVSHLTAPQNLCKPPLKLLDICVRVSQLTALQNYVNSSPTPNLTPKKTREVSGKKMSFYF